MPLGFKLGPKPQKAAAGLRGLKKIITIVFLVVVLFLIWTLFTGQQYGEFRATMGQRSRVLAELADVNKQIAEIESLSDQLGEMSSADIDKLNKSLPLGEGLEDFLASMHKMAQQSGLTILSMFVTPQSTAADQGSQLRTSQLSLTLRGSYTDTLSFLDLLERHARVVNINSITLANVAPAIAEGAVASSRETLQINITASLYNLADIPETPLFPYGRSFDLTLLSTEQFQLAQVISSLLPTDITTQTNPFAPR